MSANENPGVNTIAALIAFVLILFLIAWAVESSLIYLCGPIIPDTWRSVFAVAGILLGLRFVFAGAKPDRNKAETYTT